MSKARGSGEFGALAVLTKNHCWFVRRFEGEYVKNCNRFFIENLDLRRNGKLEDLT